MPYDFSALNDKEFPVLVCDLLNAEYDLNLQSFKPGRDGGIDLRESSASNPNALVVQVKHWLHSPAPAFEREMLNVELPKVKKLKVGRYMVVTSLPLNAAIKDRIKKAFKPFIKSANDIIGTEDLNRLLSLHGDVETRWYKLWLSSTNILKRILHNAVLGRSAFQEATIKKQIRLYVSNGNDLAARKLLNEHKYILITGLPGVGKTTLAYFLTYTLLAEGYELVYIDRDVKDAEEIFNDDPEKKQVFFFDDFLGSNYLELMQPKTSESALVHFIQRVQDTPGKLLLLTTRTTIYQTALEYYERLRRTRIDLGRKEINLGTYTELEKATILYNHFYHSTLPKTCLASVSRNRNYWQIIRHTNYNPRLIEFITNPKNLPKDFETNYMQFVSTTLDNPAEVWRHAYENQMSVEERLLLHVVFSSSGNLTSELAKMIFDQFLKYEVEQYNHRPSRNPFDNACRKLLDGILQKETFVTDKSDKVNFVNPSIHDFLQHYFMQHEEEKWKLFETSSYVEQFEFYVDRFVINANGKKWLLPKEQVNKFAKLVLNKAQSLQTIKQAKSEARKKAYIHLKTASILEQLRITDKTLIHSINDFSFRIVSNSNPASLTKAESEDYLEILLLTDKWSDTYSYVIRNWETIVTSLFKTFSSEYELEDVLSLFKLYNVDYSRFIKRPGVYEIIEPVVLECAAKLTTEWIEDEKDEITSEDEWEELKDKVKDKRSEYLSKFEISYVHNDVSDFFDEFDIGEILAENEDGSSVSPTAGKIKTRDNTKNSSGDESDAINDLFE